MGQIDRQRIPAATGSLRRPIAPMRSPSTAARGGWGRIRERPGPESPGLVQPVFSALSGLLSHPNSSAATRATRRDAKNTPDRASKSCCRQTKTPVAPLMLSDRPAPGRARPARASGAAPRACAHAAPRTIRSASSSRSISLDSRFTTPKRQNSTRGVNFPQPKRRRESNLFPQHRCGS
jgi:hypothetical protein